MAKYTNTTGGRLQVGGVILEPGDSIEQEKLPRSLQLISGEIAPAITVSSASENKKSDDTKKSDDSKAASNSTQKTAPKE